MGSSNLPLHLQEVFPSRPFLDFASSEIPRCRTVSTGTGNLADPTRCRAKLQAPSSGETESEA
jgi:hypothetical protein